MHLKILRAAELLFDGVVELRILNAYRDGRRCGTVSGYFDDYEELAAAAASYQAPAVYWTLNPVLPDLLARSANRASEWARVTTSDAEVVKRRWLPIDFDPVRPTGVSATDQEHQDALARAAECRAWLEAEFGFVGLLADSGNGAHLLYRIDEPNTPETTESLRGFLESLADRFSDEAVTVDRKVYNAARIWKVYGTWARKGDDLPPRCHREAALLNTPEALEVCEIPAVQNRPPSGTNGTFDVPAFLTAHGVAVRRNKPWEGGHLWEVDCPWKSEDTHGKGALVQHASGAVSFSCRHDKCTGGWKEYRAAVSGGTAELPAAGQTLTVQWDKGSAIIEALGHHLPPVPSAPELFLSRKNGRLTVAAARPPGDVPSGWSAKSPAARTITWSCDIRNAVANDVRAVDDPLRLAEIHLDKWDRDALTCFHGDTYRYSAEEGWVVTTESELAPWIRATVQEEFDRAAHPAPVTKTLVANVFLAMQQLVTRAVPLGAQAPFWLSADGAADPLDLLCFQNGILNVRSFVTGVSEPFVSLTPRLFYEHQAEFSFDTGASAPVWQEFLDSLKQSDAWIALLQEMMGYTLWLGCDLDKVFMLHGPPRCGKSLLTKVVTDLCGGPRAACSVDLKNFTSDFGLQNALGRRLIVVPEVELPERGSASIVAKLKAVTGGDPIEVNMKYKTPVVTQLRGRIWMVTNSFVALPDPSGALLERTVPLSFTESFRDNPDLMLPSKLAAEYPGILLWALEGARRLWAAGGRFTMPESSKERLDALRSEAAPLSGFIDDCLLLDSRMAVQKVAVYQLYLNWCGENGIEEPLIDRLFAAELRASIPQLSETRHLGGRQLAATEWDNGSRRANLWLNIAPQTGVLPLSKVA